MPARNDNVASNTSRTIGKSLTVTGVIMREQSYKSALKRLRERDFDAEKAEQTKWLENRLEQLKSESGNPLVIGMVASNLAKVMSSNPEQTKENERQYIKNHYGVSCFKCHRGMAVVHFRRRTYEDGTRQKVIPICSRCLDDDYITGADTCVMCDREIVYVNTLVPALHVCSEYCRTQYHNSKRAQRTTVNCEHCGESFQQKRSDAKYCSTKCRVYANRASTG